MSHLDRSLLAVTIRMSGTVAMPAKALTSAVAPKAAAVATQMFVVAPETKTLMLVVAENPAERPQPSSRVK